MATVELAVRAPWGMAYHGRGLGERIDVPVDWSTAGIDPLQADAAALVRRSWLVHSSDGLIDASHEPTAADAEAMLTAIGDATDTQYASDAAPQSTALAAALSEVPGATNRVAVSITNTGDAPAYRVIAKLRSSYNGAHGIQLSFGRILPHQTKVREHEIPAPLDAGERNPIVVAEVGSANATAVAAHRRLKLTVAGAPVHPALEVRCAPPAAAVGPGQRARLQCDVSNSGDGPASELVYTTTAGAASTATSGPREIGPGQRVKLEFLTTIPNNARPGAQLAAGVTIRAGAATWRSPDVTVTVTVGIPAGICGQEKLTRDAYNAKLKRLQAALQSGALSQDELDRYDAALVACIQ